MGGLAFSRSWTKYSWNQAPKIHEVTILFLGTFENTHQLREQVSTKFLSHMLRHSGQQSRLMYHHPHLGFVSLQLAGQTVPHTSRFCPDDGVDQRIRGVGGWTRPEASKLVVAPIASSASKVLVTTAALVNNEMGVDSLCSKQRSQVLDVGEFVVAHLRLVS